MTSETPMAGLQSFINSFTNAAPGGVDWLKPVSEGPLKLYGTMYKQLLAGTARQLQIQADYVAKLAACNDPATALAAQSELVQKSVGCSSRTVSRSRGGHQGLFVSVLTPPPAISQLSCPRVGTDIQLSVPVTGWKAEFSEPVGTPAVLGP